MRLCGSRNKVWWRWLEDETPSCAGDVLMLWIVAEARQCLRLGRDG